MKFQVRVLQSKYSARINKIYSGEVINGLPIYYYNSHITKKTLKVKFTPVYSFNQFINLIGIGDTEICEILTKMPSTTKKGYIVTFKGKHIPEKHAVKIGLYYYDIRSDVYLDENNEYQIKLPGIVKCELTDKYISVSNAVKSIINIDEEGNPVMGIIDSRLNSNSEGYPLIINSEKIVSSKNLSNYVIQDSVIGEDVFGNKITDDTFIINLDKFKIKSNKLKNNIPININSEQILHKLNAKEDLSRGLFFINKDDLNNVMIPRPQDYIKFNNKRSFNNRQNLDKAKEQGVYSDTFILTDGMKYTFGIELETASGVVPNYINKNLNLECMRDGSIDSGEYVTGILVGDSGISHVNKIVHELSKRCTINSKCGTHVHIGSANFNKKFTIAAFCLSEMVYNDLLEIVSPERSNNRYCNPLPSYKKEFKKVCIGTDITSNDIVQLMYSQIFNFLADGESMKPSSADMEYPKQQTHKMGRGWGRTPRYTWLNLIPCNFIRQDRNNISNDKIYGLDLAYTLEFRLYHATLSFNELYYWLLICMLFVRECEHNYNIIIHNYLSDTPYTLTDLINTVNNEKLKNNLIEFVRKSKLSSTKKRWLDKVVEVQDLNQYSNICAQLQ